MRRGVTQTIGIVLIIILVVRVSTYIRYDYNNLGFRGKPTIEILSLLPRCDAGNVGSVTVWVSPELRRHRFASDIPIDVCLSVLCTEGETNWFFPSIIPLIPYCDYSGLSYSINKCIMQYIDAIIDNSNQGLITFLGQTRTAVNDISFHERQRLVAFQPARSPACLNRNDRRIIAQHPNRLPCACASYDIVDA